MRLPGEIGQSYAAAQDHRPIPLGLVDDGRRLGAGVLGREDERVGKIVDALPHEHRDRLAAGHEAGRPLRPPERRERLGGSARMGVVPLGRHVEIGGACSLGQGGRDEDQENGPDDGHDQSECLLHGDSASRSRTPHDACGRVCRSRRIPPFVLTFLIPTIAAADSVTFPGNRPLAG
jgi:hypothetical protein